MPDNVRSLSGMGGVAMPQAADPSLLRHEQVLTAKQSCPIKQGVELVNWLPVEKIHR